MINWRDKMSYKLLILLVFIFSGCEEVNKEELRALNNYSKKVEINSTQKKSLIVVEKSLPVAIKKEVKSVENNETLVVPVVKVKPTDTSNKRFKLALAQIQKDRELEKQKEKDFQLSVIKLTNDKELMLKAKDIDFRKTEVDGNIALAEIELKKLQEGEKTKIFVQKQTHDEALLENKNRYEKDKRDALFAKEELDFYKIVAAIVGFLFLILIFVSYIFKSMKEKNIVKMSENELSHNMQLKMLEIQSKNFDKMLDLVSSGKLSENVEKELLSNIRDSQKKTLIFDQKPKKGLIFKK
jgi:hypothetical protein